MSIGERIRAARIRSGFTQEELAEKLNLSRSAVAKYEADEIEPKLSNLVALAKVLHVSTDYLLAMSGEEDGIANRVADRVIQLVETYFENKTK